MDEHRLGALLLENSFLREEELDRCLEIQELVGGIRPLGQILIEQGLLSKDSLDDLLTLQAQRRETAAATEVDAEDLVRILDAAVAASVEEIILSEGRRVMVRVACQLQPLTSEPINRQKLLQFLRIHMGEDVPRQLEQQRFVRQDFVKAGVARGRMVAFCHADGLGVVVRLHPTEPRQFSELGLDDEIAAIAQANQGLILVVGEKRSGVTETLGSLLHLVAQQENRVVLVLDENLEYAVPEAGSFVIRRRVGEHTEDYSTGLGSAFDQDADIVIVGDASGPGVFEQCLRAAEAGRLVIAALPAKSVGQALSRSLSFYPPREWRGRAAPSRRFCGRCWRCSCCRR